MGHIDQANVWEDVLGTGTILKKLIIDGYRDDEQETGEDLRKCTALICVETKCNGNLIASESHDNFIINNEADLISGIHLVLPLMNPGEQSLFRFHPKFGFGERGLKPDVAPNSELECLIQLKARIPGEDFLAGLTDTARLNLAKRKKARGRFWFDRSEYNNAITVYKSMAEILSVEPQQ